MQYFIKVKFQRLLAVIWHCRARIDYKIRKHYSTCFGPYCVLSTNHRESIYFAISVRCVCRARHCHDCKGPLILVLRCEYAGYFLPKRTEGNSSSQFILVRINLKYCDTSSNSNPVSYWVKWQTNRDLCTLLLRSSSFITPQHSKWNQPKRVWVRSFCA